ncbi:MAG: hypothetical protein AOA65_2223 [Candidatus Bathyarchaeota archaeon BA1]|nr:MAG: hypothetical protein AOA65_2223 [Candidatus Bathyarchaeota archaeon BA1]
MEELSRIQSFTEVKPPAWMLIEAALERERLDMELVVKFRIDEKGKVKQRSMEVLEAGVPSAKTETAIAMFRGYLEEVARSFPQSSRYR